MSGTPVLEMEKRIRDLERENKILRSATVQGDQIQKLYVDAIAKLQNYELEMRSIREFQQLIIDTLDSHIAILDSNGIIVNVNEAWKHWSHPAALSGDPYSPGTDYVAAMTDNAPQNLGVIGKIQEGLQRIFRMESGYFDHEYRLDSQTGALWFVIKATGFRFNENTKILIEHQNITRMKTMQITLQKSEKRVRNIIESAPVGIFITDNKGAIEFVNPAFWHLFGYRPDELLGKPESILLPKPIPTSEDVRWSDGEMKVATSEQRELTTLVDSTPIQDPDGSEKRLTFVRDITARKMMEEEIRENHNFLQTLIQNLPTAVYVKEPLSKRIILWNKACEALFGYTNAEVIGKTAWDLFPTEVAGLFTGLDDKAYFSKSRVDLAEIRFDSRSLGERILHITKVPIVDKTGLVRSILCIAQDFTEMKNAEQSIRDSESQLRKSNATKDRILSLIAHDTRGPVGNFGNVIDLILSSEMDDEKDERITLLKEIGKSAKSTFELLENLLNWARSQQNQIQPAPADLPLMPFGEQVVSLFAGQAINKQIALTVSVPEDIVVYTDRSMLLTILRNLVSNALKFTPRGGTIFIGTRPAKPGFCEVIVRDNGVGIPPETMEKLFHTEHLVTTYGTEREKGTGLGLLLVKEFVEKCGGVIGVESIPGQGSTFYFTVPLSEESGIVPD